jgi:hypothetical protein
MESYLIDTTDVLAVADVVAAYWELTSPELLCSPNFLGPDVSSVRNGKYTPIICKEGDEVLGVMLIKEENNGIYYPAMKGTLPETLAPILESMVECAQDNYDTLEAKTDNQFIHELAESIDRPMTREGNTLTWSK